MQRLIRPILLATASFLFSTNLAWSADPTLTKGYSSTGNPTKGIVIHLHGCGGLSARGFVEAWFMHLEQSGFKVIGPNSFADQRPLISCAEPFPNKGEIYRIRADQTARVVTILRQQQPGKRLYIWGHSEGGGVANLIEDKVDGIITTGYQCGFRDTGKTQINREVPLLVIVGNEAHDPAIHGARQGSGHSSQEALCAHVFGGNPQWQFIEVPTVGHLAPIYNTAVLGAVNSFLGIEKEYLGPDGYEEKKNTSGIKFSEPVKERYWEKFANAKSNKAFVIGPNNTWGYVSGRASEVDAVQEALYFCNSYLRQSLAMRDQRCAIYSINDRIVFRKK